MKFRLLLLVLLLPLCGVQSLWANHHGDKVKVVASFSILADMVEQVGGERVEVISLVGRNGDPHVYEPTPQDIRHLKQADLLVVNGLEFEGWISRLVDSSHYGNPVLVATNGVKLINTADHDEQGDHDKKDDHEDKKNHAHEEEHQHAAAHLTAHDETHAHDKEHDKEHDHHVLHKKEDHADEHETVHHEKEEHADEHEHAQTEHDEHDHGIYDPHAWQSLVNGQIYVKNILDSLSDIAPQHKDYFRSRAEQYQERLHQADQKIKAALQDIPRAQRVAIVPHDAFGYLGQEYGITFLTPVGMSTESEPSAKQVANLIRQMRSNNIKVVFTENIADPRLIKQIANDAGGVIGGKLYTGALSEEKGAASTYLDMVTYNVMTIRKALLKTM